MKKSLSAKKEFLMNLAEYEVMYRVEKDHWWYRGLREILFRWTWRAFRETTPPVKPARFKILDAGCGTGINLALHQRAGFAIWGVDASPEAVAFTRKRGAKRTAEALIQKLPFKKGFFDLIYSMDVLYMLSEREVRKAFLELKRCLRPGGTLILNSATLNFLYSSHDVASGGVARHSKKILERLLLDAGFHIRKSTYRLFLLFPILAGVKLIQRIGLRKQTAAKVQGDLEKTNRLLNIIFHPVMRLENALLKVFNLPIGTSLFIVAESVSRFHRRGKL